MHNPYVWLKPEERSKRDAHIRELWMMGETLEALADRFDLSKTRIRQIILKP
jgi:DNA-directed RNA polymerase sigma subunit (sigma70/sigma32)